MAEFGAEQAVCRRWHDGRLFFRTSACGMGIIGTQKVPYTCENRNGNPADPFVGCHNQRFTIAERKGYSLWRELGYRDADDAIENGMKRDDMRIYYSKVTPELDEWAQNQTDENRRAWLRTVFQRFT